MWARFFEKTTAHILRHPFRTLALFFLCTSLHVFFAAQLQIDFRPESLFQDKDPRIKSFRSYQDRWGDGFHGVTLLVSKRDGDFLSAESLGQLAKLTAHLEKNPHVQSVTGHLHEPLFLADEAGVLRYTSRAKELARYYQQKGEQPEESMKALDSFLKLVNEKPAPFLSKNASAALLFVSLRGDLNAVHQLPPILQSLQNSVGAFPRQSQLDFAFAGIPVMRSYFYEQTKKEQMLFFPLALLSMAFLLFLFYRNMGAIAMMACCGFIPVLLLAGAMGFTHEPVGMINQILFTLIPAFALADGIHLLNRVLGGGETKSGKGPFEQDDFERRILDTAKEILPVCFFTSLTTSIAFLSLVFSDVGPVRGFGIYGAWGIFYAFCTLWIFFPAFLSFPPVRHYVSVRLFEGQSVDAMWPIGRVTEKVLLPFTRFILRHPKRNMIVLTVFLALGIASISKLRIDNELSALLPKGGPISAAMHQLDTQFGGGVQLAVQLHPLGLDQLDMPLLKQLHDFETWLLQQPEILSTASGVRLFKNAHEALSGQKGLPQTDAQIAQYGLLLEGPVKARFFTQDHGRIFLGVQESGGTSLLQLMERIEERGHELWGEKVKVEIHGTISSAFMKLRDLVSELWVGFFLACLSILLVLGFIFRNPALVALSVFPNVFPVFCALAFLGLMNWPLDLGPAVLCTVAFGIAVDDTLHFMSHYQRSYMEKTDVNEAILKTIRHAGVAILVSSLVLGIGFFMHSFSSFESVGRLGALGAIMMAAACVGDLVFLPLMLKTVMSFGKGKK
jgi:uncharacterized protein